MYKIIADIDVILIAIGTLPGRYNYLEM